MQLPDEYGPRVDWDTYAVSWDSGHDTVVTIAMWAEWVPDRHDGMRLWPLLDQWLGARSLAGVGIFEPVAPFPFLSDSIVMEACNSWEWPW